MQQERIGEEYWPWSPTIGKGHGVPREDFVGSMDDVRIYDRALSAEEIAQLHGFPDIVGSWELTAIGEDVRSGSNSTWTFKANGTYDWSLSIPPLYDWQGTGAYTVSNDTVYVDGVISDTGTPFVVVTLGNGTFSFLDDEADKWIYQQRAPQPQPEPPVITERTPDFDGDGSVGFPDFLQFAQNFGKSQDDADFDPKYDLDGSGSVDFPDFLAFAQAFGK